MTWQDIVITICCFGLSAALAPTLFSKQKPHRASCLLFVVTQTVFSITFATMGFWLSVAGNGLAAVLWLILLLQKRE